MRLVEYVARLLGRREEEPEEDPAGPVVYTLGEGGWGHHISWWPEYRVGDTEQEVYGHMTPVPESGDLVRVPMESGRATLWMLSGIERQRDPPDMFFAKATFLRYETEEDRDNLPRRPRGDVLRISPEEVWR